MDSVVTSKMGKRTPAFEDQIEPYRQEVMAECRQVVRHLEHYIAQIGADKEFWFYHSNPLAGMAAVQAIPELITTAKTLFNINNGTAE